MESARLISTRSNLRGVDAANARTSVLITLTRGSERKSPVYSRRPLSSCSMRRRSPFDSTTSIERAP